MKAADLDRLAPLVAAEYRARQARLADLKRQEQDLLDRLDDLAARPASSDGDGNLDPATLAGADLRWMQWADVRRTEINHMLARLRADQDRATSELRQAFGRNNVIDSLCKSNEAGRRR